jgi:hypothetical protein
MEKLETLMKQHQYPPALIFNFDETMLHPGKNNLKVLVRSTGQRPTSKMITKEEHITFGVCVSAVGGKLPPLLILPLKTLPDLPPSLLNYYTITGQSNGWITTEIYSKWIIQVFIPYVVQKRRELNLPNTRALLIVDGHSSRLDATSVSALQQYAIDELVIPAHSSTILQPLDLAPFASFKSLLSKHFKPQTDEPKDARRIKLLAIAAMCLDTALSLLHVTSGFVRAGIYPFNKLAPLNSSLLKPLTHTLTIQHSKRRKRGPQISGTLLTGGQPMVLLPTRDSVPALPPLTHNTIQGVDSTT